MKQNKVLVLLWMYFSTSFAISSSWRPIIPTQLGTGILHQEAALYGNTPYNDEETSLTKINHYQHEENDQCGLYKVVMNQQLYFEVNIASTTLISQSKCVASSLDHKTIVCKLTLALYLSRRKFSRIILFNLFVSADIETLKRELLY